MFGYGLTESVRLFCGKLINYVRLCLGLTNFLGIVSLSSVRLFCGKLINYVRAKFRTRNFFGCAWSHLKCQTFLRKFNQYYLKTKGFDINWKYTIKNIAFIKSLCPTLEAGCFVNFFALFMLVYASLRFASSKT